MKGRNSSFCLVGKEGPSSGKTGEKPQTTNPLTFIFHIFGLQNFFLLLIFSGKKKKKEKLHHST